MDSGSQLSRMLYRSYLVFVSQLSRRYPLMQVRWVDQTQYPMIVVASLSAVPQSCRTPLPNQYLDCMLLAVYTHTWPLNMRGKSVRSTVKLFLSTPLHQRLYGLVLPKTTKKTMD